MSSTPELVVEDSAEQLAEATAVRVVATVAAALEARGLAHIAITGGGILEAVLRAVRPKRDSLDWSRVHIWWGDERFVPAGSEDRNDKAAFTALLDDLPLDPTLIHRMPAADGSWPDVEAAAGAYAAELAAAAGGTDAVPAFDVVLLGVGPDGHCASLFPNHPAARIEDRAVVGVHDSPKPPPLRTSLTFPALDAANEIWFIASGEGKADAVRLAFSGASRYEVPSAGPRGRNRTLWLIDRAAASALRPDRD